MQNSIPRLLDATAGLMREVAAEHVADRYVAAQLYAAAEVLDNLAPRVEWRVADLRELVERARAVLAAVPEGVVALPEADPDDLEGSRDAHLRGLAEAQTWIVAHGAAEAPAAVAELHGFLRWQLDVERSLVRTGAEA